MQDGAVKHFGKPDAELLAARDGTVLSVLSRLGALRVSGEDAQSFLQNLLSNDIREVGSTQAQFSGFNTAKGRILAILLIWREGNDYLLQLPRVLCDPVRKKLSMYVLRAKVKVGDVSGEFVSLGLSGAKAQELLSMQFPELPQTPLGVLRNSQCSIIRLDDMRFLINTSAAHATALWPVLTQNAKPVSGICWDWLNIRSGIPVILPQTQEQFVAQMVNLELIGGVSFRKGCYPGQEIVARTQYLGKLKRRMYLAHIDNGETPLPGDELYSAEMEGQASGMIVDAAPAPGGGYDVLASVQVSSRETQQVLCKSMQGAALHFLPLPYPLQDA